MASANEAQDDITDVSNRNELICFVQQRSKAMAVEHFT